MTDQWYIEERMRDFRDISTGKVINLTDMLLRAVEDECPVVTGELRDSHDTDINQDESGDKIEGMVYTECPYAVFVNLGTPKQSAEPYMVNALDSISEDIMEEF
jgi:HK97 gp10 family phage protein